jgi:hypothetical protein
MRDLSDSASIIKECHEIFKKRKGKKGNTFLSGGSIGDLLANLYIMKKAGGGILYVRLAGDEPFESDKETLDRLSSRNPYIASLYTITSEDFVNLKPLLEAQPYISEVKHYNGEEITFDLDLCRICYFDKGLLDKTQGIRMKALKETWGTPVSFKKPWISVEGSEELDRKVLISRSYEYHGGDMFYKEMKQVIDESFFIGHSMEFLLFLNLGVQPWKMQNNNMLDIAKMLNSDEGAELVISNDTWLYWLALGMGFKDIMYELCPDYYNGICDNKNVKYFLGDTFVIPELK